MSETAAAPWRTSADLGGLPGMGPVQPEVDEPLFHAAWERQALALTLAMGATGAWTIDHARAARESLPLQQYRSSSYYQIWIAALEQLMLQRGLISADELAQGQALSAAVPLPRRLQADQVAAGLARGAPTSRALQQPAAFVLGQQVRTRSKGLLFQAGQAQAPGHTRLPAYARGRTAVVVAVHGGHVFPDRHSLGLTPPYDERPEWLYTVQFRASSLWSDQGAPAASGRAAPETAGTSDSADTVCIDAWEPYLEALP